jgi:hypothetical protein
VIPTLIVSLEESIARDGDLTRLDGNLLNDEENLIEWNQEMRAREGASAVPAPIPASPRAEPNVDARLTLGMTALITHL